jgi:S-formylglutathione hydrolase FrmB
MWFVPRRQYILLLLLLAALLLGGCAPATAPAVPTAAVTAPEAVTPTPEAAQAKPGEMKIESFKFTSEALANNLLGDPATRTILVLLPPGYDSSTKHYPVVYALHGYMGDSYSLVLPFKTPFEEARKAGKVQDMIFVFPDANNKLYGSWYLDSPTIGGYETHITKELVNYIDANYRTLAKPESRGITGCSMGGAGSAHLALAHPDVFGVTAPITGRYDYSTATWPTPFGGFKPPTNLAQFELLGLYMQAVIARAAATSPNPDNPPFYLDMPWETSDDQAQVVAAVAEKMAAADPMHDAERYAKGSQRLSAFMLLHGSADTMVPVEEARAFDKRLTDLGIAHEYVEIDAGHCGPEPPPALYSPVVQFMSDHLVSETPTEQGGTS